MKFTIDRISAEHSCTQQRFEWYIEGDIDGRPVSMTYLDSGNNAQYDTSTVLNIDASNDRDQEAIENWFDESLLSDLGKGSVIDLPEPKAPAKKPLPTRFPSR